uniref:Uncharacterized protein n=1 Tax=Cacopsylla melanoneura TaxID=428564 RepID=A0A8D9BW82_9HEMI
MNTLYNVYIIQHSSHSLHHPVYHSTLISLATNGNERILTSTPHSSFHPSTPHSSFLPSTPHSSFLLSPLIISSPPLKLFTITHSTPILHPSAPHISPTTTPPHPSSSQLFDVLRVKSYSIL